jgi:hypothetical protein
VENYESFKIFNDFFLKNNSSNEVLNFDVKTLANRLMLGLLGSTLSGEELLRIMCKNKTPLEKRICMHI